MKSYFGLNMTKLLKWSVLQLVTSFPFLTPFITRLSASRQCVKLKTSHLGCCNLLNVSLSELQLKSDICSVRVCVFFLPAWTSIKFFSFSVFLFRVYFFLWPRTMPSLKTSPDLTCWLWWGSPIRATDRIITDYITRDIGYWNDMDNFQQLQREREKKLTVHPFTRMKGSETREDIIVEDEVLDDAS